MGSDNRTATTSKPRPKWRDRHLGQLNAEQLAEVQEARGEEAVAEMIGTESVDTRSQSGKARRDKVQRDNSQKDRPLRDKPQRNKPQRNESERAMPQRQAGPTINRDKRVSDEQWPSQQGCLPEHFKARPGQESRQHSNQDKYSDQAQRRDSRDHRHHRQEAYEQDPRTRSPRSDQRNVDPEFARDDQHADDRHIDHRRDDHRRDDHRRDRGDVYREDVNREARSRLRTPEHNQPAQRSDRRHPEDHVASGEARHKRDRREDLSDRNEAKARHQRAGSAQDRPATRNPHNEQTENKTGMFTKLANFRMSRPLKYGLMAVAVAAMIAVSFFKPIDNSSQTQLDSALTRAMIGFGLARTLNGVISVAQGTEFAVQPAGVGVNFSPGEILDPINDLVERFSWVMLLATSSLGVQKILLEVSSWAGISVLLAGAGLFFLLTRLRNSAVASMADIAAKLLLLMLLVRFLIPLGSIANDWVYKQFLQPHFEHSSEQLEIASERIREISTRQTSAEKPPGSLTERAKGFYKSMTSKFDFDGMLNDYKQSAENVSENAVNLIVVFLLQTIVFPLLFLYLIYRLFKSFIVPARNRVQ